MCTNQEQPQYVILADPSFSHNNLGVFNSDSIEREMWRQNWPLELSDCLTFKHRGGSLFCPFFFPMALCGTCILAGRTITLLKNEEPICFGLGKKGGIICTIGMLMKCLEPAGGCCFFAFTSLMIRKQVSERFNIVDPQPILGLCYPCSLFQSYATLLVLGELSQSIDPEQALNNDENLKASLLHSSDGDR
jgi:hypothetical protein